jgi:hypothetical protein
VLVWLAYAADPRKALVSVRAIYGVEPELLIIARIKYGNNATPVLPRHDRGKLGGNEWSQEDRLWNHSRN